MGKISKGIRCSVEGCDKEAVRSLDLERAQSAGLKVRGERRAYLCKIHYKEYKKAIRKNKIIDKWRRTAVF